MTDLTAKRFFSLRSTLNDPAKESEFFSSLKMRNGTFKLTRPSRFADIEAELATILGQRTNSFQRVLDVGASIGSTTVELADFLSGLGASPRVTGTDLFINAHLIEIAPGFRVLTDADGWPLQYDIAGRAVRAWTRRLDYFTLAFAPRLLARAILGSRLRRKIADAQTARVKMVSRILSGRDIELVENDILVPTSSFVGQFDFIRAANILNVGYFPAEQLAAAISNIKSYCCGPGALVLILRTTGTENNGTLFELDADEKFTALARIGNGSEVESLVLGDETATDCEV